MIEFCDQFKEQEIRTIRISSFFRDEIPAGEKQPLYEIRMKFLASLKREKKSLPEDSLLKRFTASALISAQVPDEKRLHRRAPYTWWFDCSAQTVHKRWALASPALAGRTSPAASFFAARRSLGPACARKATCPFVSKAVFHAGPFGWLGKITSPSSWVEGTYVCHCVWLWGVVYYVEFYPIKGECTPSRKVEPGHPQVRTPASTRHHNFSLQSRWSVFAKAPSSREAKKETWALQWRK